MIKLPRQQMTRAFHAVGLRPAMMPLGHVLNIDHFHMSEPTFPPHPHAGFSAVTWMLPWSKGAFINRDCRGDRSRIGPGELHWTQAGSGMLHEEIPEVAGSDCEGLQMFVKLPESEEMSAPRAFHLNAEQVPVFEAQGARVRVLVGTVGGVRSPIPEHSGTTLAQVSAAGSCSLQIPEGVDAFAMVLRGEGLIAGQRVESACALQLGVGAQQVEGVDLDLLLGWSPRMPQQPVFDGPFCMYERTRLADAFQRFRSGQMGALAPSPVRWQRS